MFKKLNDFQFCQICGNQTIKKVRQLIFVFLSSLDPVSRMEKNPDRGPGINIPDPQHCPQNLNKCRVQVLGMCVGVGIMALIALYEDDLKTMFLEP